MTSPQDQLKTKLTSLGLPYKDIEVYGGQVVVTSWSAEAARKWAAILSRFATVRGITRSMDECKDNRNTCLRPSKVEVYRTFAKL